MAADRIGLFTSRLNTRLVDKWVVDCLIGGYNGGLVVPTGGELDIVINDSISSNICSLPSRERGEDTLNIVKISSSTSNGSLDV